MKLRDKLKEYKPLPPIPRSGKGNEQRQRPLDKEIPLLGEGKGRQEDNIYHVAYVNRVSTEMARPHLGKRGDLAGFDIEKLRIAGLARCVQTKLSLHACSTRYCLLNRAACRFFFPSGAYLLACSSNERPPPTYWQRAVLLLQYALRA